jgi:hypothetical protein
MLLTLGRRRVKNPRKILCHANNKTMPHYISLVGSLAVSFIILLTSASSVYAFQRWSGLWHGGDTFPYATGGDCYCAELGITGRCEAECISGGVIDDLNSQRKPMQYTFPGDSHDIYVLGICDTWEESCDSTYPDTVLLAANSLWYRSPEMALQKISSFSPDCTWHSSCYNDPPTSDYTDIWIYYVYKKQSSCNLSGLTISPSEIWPTRTEDGIFTQATIGIALTNPAPSSGCEVRLRIEPVEGSGGHNHVGNRTTHTGSVDPDSVIFVPGESIVNNIVYNSGEVAGTERIIAEVLDGNGSVSSTQSVSVDVKVPDLVSLGGFISYQLVGSLDAHPANHYGTASTVTNAGNVADAYYVATGELLGINDMSLVWGGLFDINGDWSTPHGSHRKGMSVDIDLCALSTIPNDPNPKTCVVAYDAESDDPIYHTCSEKNYVCVPADRISTFCSEKGNGSMANELTHHCEFPQ